MKDTKDESIARSFLLMIMPREDKIKIMKLSGSRCLDLFRGGNSSESQEHQEIQKA